MGLKDKVCIITGGGSGIGLASAIMMSEEGAKLALVDVTDPADEFMRRLARDVAHGIEQAGVVPELALDQFRRQWTIPVVAVFGLLDFSGTRVSHIVGVQ